VTHIAESGPACQAAPGAVHGAVLVVGGQHFVARPQAEAARILAAVVGFGKYTTSSAGAPR
jgi:hypothetical protein